MLNFLSNLISKDYINATVAVIVGLFVFIAYYKSKFDYKRDAANIILLEIQNAERQISQIKEALVINPNVLPDYFIMPSESWSKYNYLFITDFKRDEWDKITNFYKNSKLLDRAVEYNKSFFQKNEQEIRVNIQRISSDYIKEHSKFSKKNNNTKITREINSKVNQFITEYLALNTTNQLVPYSPIKPITDANIYLSSLDSNLSLMSIGNKLEKIGSSKFFLLF